ncbi:TPA: hypothetical protein N0F65_006691 [Lagenidium giganteum]|uniref:Uncharacterized protein n=1 Tax=Lagenidium giganteum TaxID=4803 RepID=A0AAV2Z4S7_9STRA|nr:TPA: hypothetical protein N0F65_006691 [Lagenidium giganteum]
MFNIANCSQLVIPPQLRNFSFLVGFSISHSGIAEWNADAAVTQDSHPRIQFIAFAYVLLTGVPEGILHDIPHQLRDIEFSHTNLTVIPSDINESWSNVGTLYIEYSNVQHIPESLMHMALIDLSLIGNGLVTVPELAQLPSSIGFVALDNNPLIALPDKFDNSADFEISQFSLENTEVTTVPAVLLDTTSVHFLYMQGTPYCASTSRKDEAPCLESYELPTGKCLMS